MVQHSTPWVPIMTVTCCAQSASAGNGGAEHADITIQSTHKMLSALTQASMLHVRGARGVALADRISRALQALQVLARSLDLCTAC